MTISSGVYSIKEILPEQEALWMAFVAKHHGHYGQVYAWRAVLTQSYGLKTLFLGAFQAQTLCALLPVALLPFPRHKHAVSLPYCNYAGLLCVPGVQAAVVMSAMWAYLLERGVQSLEIRTLPSKDTVAQLGYFSQEVTLRLALPDTKEALWQAVGPKVRNQIRKAQRANLKVAWGRNTQFIQHLHTIYAENMGRLGTPVHGRAFIEAILNAFEHTADILTVSLEETVIAAMLVIKHDDIWVDPIASSRIAYKQFNPNMLLYWEAIEKAIAAGAKTFDFGRSQKNSGTYHFKTQWGAQSYPLDYTRYPESQHSKSVATEVYRSRKARLFSKIWQHLPAWLQVWMGPKVRCYLP